MSQDAITTSHPFTDDANTARQFYCWACGNLLLSIASLFTAFYPPSLPNCSLLCYGFASICLWQMSVNFDCYRIRLTQLPTNGRSPIGGALLLSVSFFVYVGKISSAATFRLFPHPDLLERFTTGTPLHTIGIAFYVPSFVYIPALIVAASLIYQIWIVLQGRYTPRMLHLLQGQKRRQELREKWRTIASTTPARTSAQDTTVEFKLTVSNFLVRQLVLMSLWMLIPIWILVVLPLQSFPEFSQIPTIFLIGMSLTGVGYCWWLYAIIIAIGYRLRIGKESIRWEGITANQLIWKELDEAVLLDHCLLLKDCHGKKFKLWLNALPEPYTVWQTLFKYLPGEVFFIGEDGWYYLRKTLGSHQEIFAQFLAQYQAIWSTEDKKQKRKK